MHVDHTYMKLLFYEEEEYIFVGVNDLHSQQSAIFGNVHKLDVISLKIDRGYNLECEFHIPCSDGYIQKKSAPC